MQRPRACTLPVADAVQAQCVPWSIVDEGVLTEENIGYHKRTTNKYNISIISEYAGYRKPDQSPGKYRQRT